MKPDSTSYENILEVENWGSQLSTFYKIMSPVQITLESCTGLGETDQYSIQMFSPNGCWLHENSMDALFRALSSRPLHRHDYFELMLVLEGEVIQQIEEKEYPYRAGTCCLVNRSIPHRPTTQIYQPHPLLRTVPAKVRHDPATMAQDAEKRRAL